MSGPAKPAAAPGSVIHPAKPPLPALPSKGALPHSGKPVAVNGQGNGAAMANAVNAGMQQPSASAAKPTISKTVSVPTNDAKSAPGAAAVSKVADAKVGAGKDAAPAAPLTQRERAQQLAVGIKQRALKAAEAVYKVFQDEYANVGLIHHQTGAYPAGTSSYTTTNLKNGVTLTVYFRFNKLIEDAKAYIKSHPLTPVEQQALPHLLKITATAIRSNESVTGHLERAEPGVPFEKSQIVHEQAVATLKKYPF